MIRINGTQLPIPCSYDWSFQDLDKDSGRNDYGLMERERLGTKTKLLYRGTVLKIK